MKEIKLTQGYVALVDDEDFERVSQCTWQAEIKSGRKNLVYASCYVKGSKTSLGKSKRQMMHRLIMGVDDPEIKVDHRDHDGLNNQKYNLRPATNAQNVHSQGVCIANTSGFKGVAWHKRSKKWQAFIKVDKKFVYLGTFIDPLEAACAYDVAAIMHFGEFAVCNFAEAS